MFETLQMAPPDAILGLTEAFKNDPNPDKINLSVGIFQDAEGKTPTLNAVKEAERRMAEQGRPKSYLPIDGLAEYRQAVQQLVFGADHPLVTSGRAATLQTPGGTAALRVAGELVQQLLPTAHIWCSQPTWANHANIFSAAGLQVEIYPYFDADANQLAFEQTLQQLREMPPGHVVCLHACCHNPTGIDPTREQWKQIGEVLVERKLLPLVDFAYQGFGDGLQEDAAGLLELAEIVPEMFVCSSYSKNFGLYAERVGALTIVGTSAEHAKAALSHAKRCVRSNYSNPPSHGAEIVATVLADQDLRKLWQDELTQMRSRINGMRTLFADTMKAKRLDRDFSFITQQRGMFSFSGLTPVQVDELRSKYAIYMIGNGRINVAGMTPSNMDRLCEAIAGVL